MTNLETISADYLREILAEVDDTDAAKRLMVAITFKEVDELSQNTAADLYGFSSGGPHAGSDASNGPKQSHSRTPSMTNHAPVVHQNSPRSNVLSSKLS